jgi:hypothetical protein
VRIQVADPTINWLALQPQSDHKKVMLITGEAPRIVGTTTEDIALVEVGGLPALRRTQVLESDELGDRRSETVVFQESFLPHSHSDVTAAWTLSVRYRGTAIAGEKRLASGRVIPIKAEVASPVFDAHSVEMVLRVLPLADGYVAELPVFHGGRGTHMLVVARAFVLDTVTVSGHSVEAWKVRTDWDGVTQYYWIGVESGELLRQWSELSEGVQLEFVRG